MPHGPRNTHADDFRGKSTRPFDDRGPGYDDEFPSEAARRRDSTPATSLDAGFAAGSGPVPHEGTLVGEGKGPRNFVRSDERLRERVCERLEDSGIDARDIDVTVQDGDVTLAGSVRDREAKRDAEDCVYSARGVRECHNRLRVRASAGDAP